ncbi:MAG: class I SAM-dependent methyltransferase [Deltaproteobacteria bacterium]|nr:class I SAM-dependent methyltransferase [Deltaproteobacteria bacterium]
MNAKTQQALIDINRAFYAGVADDFSDSRRDPWPGWRRALRQLKQSADRSISVLDVGCGNGRFASFLEDELGQPFRYLGLDSSSALLSHARGAGDSPSYIEFAQREILDSTVQLVPAGSRYDLIALFGVLHHVPAEASRRDLLQRLISQLTVGGILIVTAWQFGAFERFRARMLPWQTYNDRISDAFDQIGADQIGADQIGEDQIDERELEAGDHLLRWGATSLPRYCHFTNPDELRELLATDRAEWVDEFSADGKTGDLNRYAVLRRRSDPNE